MLGKINYNFHDDHRVICITNQLKYIINQNKRTETFQSYIYKIKVKLKL